MQRYLSVTLIVFAVLCAEGCRRARSVQEPIKVIDENDLLLTRDTYDLLIVTKPKKLFTLDVDTIKPPQGEDEKWTFPPGLFDANAEIKWVEPTGDTHKKALTEAQKVFQALQKLEMMKKRKAAVEAVAKQYVGFYRDKKDPFSQRTLDNLKKYIRRNKEREVRFDVDNQRVKPVVLIDDRTPNQLIAYSPTVEDKLGHGCALVDFTKVGQPQEKDPEPQFKYLPTDELTEVLQQQELLLLRRMYVDFATPKYLDFSAAGRHGEAVEKYAKERPAENLQLLDTQLKQVVDSQLWKDIDLKKTTTLLKAKPDEHTPKDFQRFLKDKAPAPLEKVIEKNEIYFNYKADLRDSKSLIAAQPKGNEKKGGFLTIDASGEMRYMKDTQLIATFPDFKK